MVEAEALTQRDAALLRAVADGRCELEDGPQRLLYVDGRVCCDTAAGYRLVRADLVAADPGTGRAAARLTDAGRDYLRRRAD